MVAGLQVGLEMVAGREFGLEMVVLLPRCPATETGQTSCCNNREARQPSFVENELSKVYNYFQGWSVAPGNLNCILARGAIELAPYDWQFLYAYMFYVAMYPHLLDFVCHCGPYPLESLEALVLWWDM